MDTTYTTIGYLSPTRTFIRDTMQRVGNRAFGVQIDPATFALPPETDLKGIIIDARDPAFVAALPELPVHVPTLSVTSLNEDKDDSLAAFIASLDLSGFDPSWCHRPPDTDSSVSPPVEV